MRLTKGTAIAFMQAVDGLGINLDEAASRYKEAGLTTKRFIWDVWHKVGYDKNMAILLEHNPNAEVIGGYCTNVTDANIETMLRTALTNHIY